MPTAFAWLRTHLLRRACMRRPSRPRVLELERLEDRRSLSRHFDGARRHIDELADSQAMDRFSQEAFDFVSGPAARRAFDIGKEDPRLRALLAHMAEQGQKADAKAKDARTGEPVAADAKSTH